MNRDDQDGQPSIRDVINPRQQKLLRLLWLNGPLSRWELHEQTGFTPNVCGALVDSMLQAGFIRECAPEPAPMGRPRVPLEIDPSSRHVLGLALVPGHVDITKFGLTGEVIGKPASRKVNGPGALVATAAGLLKEQLNSDTLAVGITSTGFLDRWTNGFFSAARCPAVMVRVSSLYLKLLVKRSRCCRMIRTRLPPAGF